MRDKRHDILFTPVRIGPVTLKNRFYQVPHCNGTSDLSPRAVARMRGIKAEGGWAAVCTEIAEVAPTTELLPFPSLHLWSDEDVRLQSIVCEEVHAHGALAGIELGHFGIAAGNRYSRVPPLGPSSQLTLESVEPVQSRVMDKADIRELRRQHRGAALRARAAGFDIVYVYASHNLSVASHFLSRRYNDRTDEYGGSLENRARLLRELIEDTKDAVGDTCAVAVRFAVDERMGEDGLTCDGEGREVVAMLAELPDLWDVNISDWSWDSDTSRFAKEGFQEPFVAFVKKVTTKPVVGVGRFTSPDTMVAQIERGILDLIGAARPSIADPFLPRKIEEGRPEDIRECIGCNVCVSGEMTYSPIRCTQNPTMMEEWRRGWHPERIEPRGSEDRVLVVGAGPAGLECALALGRRGYDVTLAEAGRRLGGRVSDESRLPGLQEWARVRDHREHQLAKLGNVEVHRESRLGLEDVLELGAPRVILATGARWRRDGVGRAHFRPVLGTDLPHVLTPHEVFAGTVPADARDVLIYDDDGTYLASALAEQLVSRGHRVTLATPAAEVAKWTFLTLEQHKILARLHELGVTLRVLARLVAVHPGSVRFAHVHSGREDEIAAGAVVMVTSRLPNDELHRALVDLDGDALRDAGIASVQRIGDCLAPNTIAAAVHSGHRAAREMDALVDPDRPYRREIVAAAA